MQNLQEREIIKLRNKLIVYISIAVVALLTLVVISISIAREKSFNHIQNDYNQQMHQNMKHVINHFVKDYSFRVRRMVETTDLASFVQTGDREATIKLLHPKFRLMQEENKHFKVMQVHLADGTSFVRLHNLKAYGDNIAKKRLMLQNIHKNHKEINAYETGEFATVYRMIHPIFNEHNQYVGALELGINPNFIIDNINQINGFCGIVFIKDNELKLHSIPNEIVIDGYRLQTDIYENKKNICKAFNPTKKLRNNQKIEVDGHSYLTHLIVMKNFIGEDSVKLIFFQDITKENPFFNFMQIVIYISIVIGLGVLLLLIYNRIKKYQVNVNHIYNGYIKKLQESETKLLESEKHLQLTFDAIPTVLIITDGHNVVRVNNAMLDFFKFDSLEAFKQKHKCVCEYFMEKDGFLKSSVENTDWLTYMKSHPNKTHKVAIRKENKIFYFLLETQDFIYNNQTFELVSFTDITELEILHDRLSIAVNGANDGIWDWNVEEGSVYFSPRWKEMLGYEDDELENVFETWQDRVHPDDLKEALEHISYAQSEPGIEYDIIHRLRHKNGSWVWILDRGKTIFNEDGKAIRMVGFHTDITKQKELEIKLLNSQKQFEHFMQFIPANIFIKNNNNEIVYYNSAMEKFHNGSVLGKRVEDVYEQEILEKIYEVEEEALKSGYAETILETINQQGEKVTFRYFTFKIVYEKDVNLGVVAIDITQEYATQHEIRKLKSALHRGPISVMMTDIHGNIEYVNPHYAEVSGFSLEEVLGKNPRIVKSKETPSETYQEMWKQISSGNVWNSDIKNVAKDGAVFWEDSTIIPSFNSKGEVDGYISFKLDITDQMAVRQQLKDQEELMISQSRHAAMGEMVSMIAHQWRQPISVISMDANNILVDIELESLEEDSLKSYVDDIIYQVSHLSHTIDDFRDFFKPNKVKDRVSVNDVYNDAYSVISKSLENSSVSVENHFVDTSEVEMFSRELMQVFINILKNAKEALVEYRTENRRIITTITEDNVSVFIRICNNGGTIKKDILERVFEPYFTTKDEKNGTGLGLYMSKTIIEKHFYGSLNVHNHEDGVCFDIEIPKRVDTNE